MESKEVRAELISCWAFVLSSSVLAGVSVGLIVSGASAWLVTPFGIVVLIWASLLVISDTYGCRRFWVVLLPNTVLSIYLAGWSVWSNTSEFSKGRDAMPVLTQPSVRSPVVLRQPVGQTPYGSRLPMPASPARAPSAAITPFPTPVAWPKSAPKWPPAQ